MACSHPHGLSSPSRLEGACSHGSSKCKERKEKCGSPLEDQAPNWYSVTFTQAGDKTKVYIQGAGKSTHPLHSESSGRLRLLYKKSTQDHIPPSQPSAKTNKQKIWQFPLINESNLQSPHI